MSSEERGLDLAAIGAQSKEEQAREESMVHGSATWFAEVVGLPNWGLNPRKDVSTSPTRICWSSFRTRSPTKATLGSNASPRL